MKYKPINSRSSGYEYIHSSNMHIQELKFDKAQPFMQSFSHDPGLQIYGRLGSLSLDFKIWPITFQGSRSSGPILYSWEKISL